MKNIIIGIVTLGLIIGGSFVYRSQTQKNTTKQFTENSSQTKKEVVLDTTKNNNELFTKIRSHSKIALLALDGSELSTRLKNKSSLKIGCDDSIIYKDINESLNAKQILETLFTFKDFDQSNGAYNVFDNSINLEVEKLEINENGTVAINLTGKLITSGMCDDPRVAAQIVKTVELLDPSLIKNIEIYINGEDIGDYLSEEDGAMNNEI
jgi:uncharacterized protein YxeA